MNALRTTISIGTLVRGVPVLLSIIGALPFAPNLRAQTDNFNSGNDALWTRYDLSQLGDPRVGATYTFPPDATNGYAYRIQATGNPYYPQAGPGRAASYRADVTYTGRFSMGADLNAWNDTIDQDFGLFFYLSTPGIGTSAGYAVTYGPRQDLEINLVADENPTEIGNVNPFHLDPTQRYRMTVSSHDGTTFLAQVFHVTDEHNPLGSVVTSDSTWTSGYSGFVLYDGTSPSITGCDATFDNYAAAVPPAGSLLTTVVDLYPPPEGQATELYPTVSVGILDRDSLVDTTSILLWMDGTLIPGGDLAIEAFLDRPNNPGGHAEAFSGATITYPIASLLPYGSKHTNSIAFADINGAWQTNTWSWTTAYPFLFASNALPVGSLNVRGVDVRMAQTNGGNNLDNSLARALQQLAIPPLIPAEVTATSLVQVLAWNTTGTPNNVPGLCASAGEIDNIAVESLMYLELAAGPHRFHVTTDDQAGFYSGVGLADPNATVLWEAPGNTADTTFDFAVEAAGLYPFRCIWEQTGGGATLNVNVVDLDDNSETLLNDPANPTNVVRAWYPLVCKSSASVDGPYVADPTAVNVVSLADVLCNGTGAPVNQMITGGTFTIPMSGASRFYRLDGPRATKLTAITNATGNIAITYQVQ